MFKKFVTGILFLGFAALPSFADNHEIKLDEEQVIKGTYQGTKHGQILMTTSDGRNLVIPSMILFWQTNPSVSQSQLEIGQEFTVVLPEDQIMRVIQKTDEPTILGSYEGVYRIPSATVATWKLDETEAASR